METTLPINLQNICGVTLFRACEFILENATNNANKFCFCISLNIFLYCIVIGLTFYTQPMDSYKDLALKYVAYSYE